MSFDYEHTVTTTATPADVWALWSNVGSWHRWDPTVEQVAIEGHFGEGAAGTMVLAKGLEAQFVLEIVEPCARYLDKLTIGDVVVRIDHQVKATAAGSDVTVRTVVNGPGSDEIAPLITAEATRALEALVEMAEKRS